ncbi:hypothetical protein [Deinococcus roseus]|uniref:Transposase n=1 Tax=Deinococcus roseus TaxID=392414 RepID=A0ABQ2D6H4_9DEIO|nr:hypothetical protein [Deinococcus roseus]GGJ47725.1 hypothetical protein GCM10008938_37130 [Deinococcus roseus]
MSPLQPPHTPGTTDPRKMARKNGQRCTLTGIVPFARYWDIKLTRRHPVTLELQDIVYRDMDSHSKWVWLAVMLNRHGIPHHLGYQESHP